jgi:hypothetical protein
MLCIEKWNVDKSRIENGESACSSSNENSWSSLTGSLECAQRTFNADGTCESHARAVLNSDD